MVGLCSPSYNIPFNEDSNSGGTNFVFGLVNALVFVAIVVVMTIVLVLLFKYRCYRVSAGTEPLNLGPL